MNQIRILSAPFVLITVIGTAWMFRQYWPGQGERVAFRVSALGETISVIHHPASKLALAGIKTQTAKRMSLPLTRMLPARFAYDDTRHVAVRAAADGVLESVIVKPGDVLAIGQTIAVLRSPAVGAARSELLTKAAESELACADRDRHAGIYQGVQNLSASIGNREPIESIEQRLSEAALGNYRGDLLTKYSKALLATQLSHSAISIRDSGAISGRVLQQRQSELEQARAELAATLDQSLFETRQAYNKAQVAADAAQRSLVVARQQLVTLLGANGETEMPSAVSHDEIDLARLQIRSPIAGTVERRAYTATERVTAGSELFIVADTSRLWVEADVRDRDWSAIQVKQGDQVVVSTPAADGERSAATIEFVGREVDLASGAIPLVATIDNKAGKYRPGLFARVEVSVGRVEDALVVPDAALVDLDGQATVFVAEGLLEVGGGYRPVSVEIGARSGDRLEIRSGLLEGQQVVVDGAFLLKSELLLEGEE